MVLKINCSVRPKEQCELVLMSEKKTIVGRNQEQEKY